MDDGGYERDLPPLVHATARGDLARVRELLAAGASPDEADEDLGSAFEVACRERHWEIARVLMRQGAIVDPPGLRRPIHHAAGGGDLDLVKSLAAAGADLSGAVGEAATAGQIHVVCWLVEAAGADVDDEDEGLTSLLNAAEAGETEMVRELIRLGADRERTIDGASAADLAAGMGHEALAAELRGESVEPPRLKWMKWFNSDWHGGHDYEDRQPILESYNAHLAKLLATLPHDLRCLREAGGLLSLHDATVLFAHTDTEQRRIIIDFETDGDPSSLEIFRVRFSYSDAELVAPGRTELRRYYGQDSVIDGELDYADGGRFEQRLQFALDYPTLVIRFADATVRITRFVEDRVEITPPAEFFPAGDDVRCQPVISIWWGRL